MNKGKQRLNSFFLESTLSNEYLVLIVDDEPLARQKIVRLLAQRGEKIRILEAESGVAALKILEGQTPDIVFLDIEMPVLSGIELLYHLEKRPFKIIFQTAYEEFAVKAFEENACDYLLKPYSPERFAAAFVKALHEIASEQRLRDLEMRLTGEERYLEHIGVKDQDEYLVIDVQEVDCFLSRDHYTCVYWRGREYLTKLSLDNLEKKLNPKAFLRVRRNAIVQLGAIRKVAGDELETLGGQTIEISRRCRPRLQEWLRAVSKRSPAK
jgi:two-component system, LytTR family, response regulator